MDLELLPGVLPQELGRAEKLRSGPEDSTLIFHTTAVAPEHRNAEAMARLQSWLLESCGVREVAADGLMWPTRVLEDRGVVRELGPSGETIWDSWQIARQDVLDPLTPLLRDSRFRGTIFGIDSPEHYRPQYRAFLALYQERQRLSRLFEELWHPVARRLLERLDGATLEVMRAKKSVRDRLRLGDGQRLRQELLRLNLDTTPFPATSWIEKIQYTAASLEPLGEVLDELLDRLALRAPAETVGPLRYLRRLEAERRAEEEGESSRDALSRREMIFLRRLTRACAAHGLDSAAPALELACEAADAYLGFFESGSENADRQLEEAFHRILATDPRLSDAAGVFRQLCDLWRLHDLCLLETTPLGHRRALAEGLDPEPRLRGLEVDPALKEEAVARVAVPFEWAKDFYYHALSRGRAMAKRLTWLLGETDGRPILVSTTGFLTDPILESLPVEGIRCFRALAELDMDSEVLGGEGFTDLAYARLSSSMAQHEALPGDAGDLGAGDLGAVENLLTELQKILERVGLQGRSRP
ncbi:MAG: hypothetical protein MI919_24280 [Holophagales bacterium]|nr:hypothetical protein [Holophagales bacterium]